LAVASAFIDIIQANPQLRPDLNNETPTLDGVPTPLQRISPSSTLVHVHVTGLIASLLSTLLALLGKHLLVRYASTRTGGSATECSRNRRQKRIIEQTVVYAEFLSLIQQVAMFLVNCALFPHFRKIGIYFLRVFACALSLGTLLVRQLLGSASFFTSSAARPLRFVQLSLPSLSPFSSSSTTPSKSLGAIIY